MVMCVMMVSGRRSCMFPSSDGCTSCVVVISGGYMVVVVRGRRAVAQGRVDGLPNFEFSCCCCCCSCCCCCGLVAPVVDAALEPVLPAPDPVRVVG